MRATAVADARVQGEAEVRVMPARTVAVTPTLESVSVLGLIVLIRTFLSWSLEVEISGRWPWQTLILCVTNDLVWWIPFGLYLRDAWPRFRDDRAQRAVAAV